MTIHSMIMRGGGWRQQRGATLITVMIIMILVTVLGLTAMRMGLSSLSLASNSQAGNILFQASDVGLNEFTRAVNATAGVADMVAVDADGNEVKGFLAEAVAATPSGCRRSEALPEFNYCFTPKLGTRLTTGTCDVSNSNHYMTGRDTVAVQVTVKPVCNTDIVLGSDASTIEAIKPYKFLVYSTSVLPAFGSASKATINDCLQRKNDDGDSFVLRPGDATSLNELKSLQAATTTVTDCLTNEGAVFTTTLNQYTYGFNL